MDHRKYYDDPDSILDNSATGSSMLAKSHAPDLPSMTQNKIRSQISEDVHAKPVLKAAGSPLTSTKVRLGAGAGMRNETNSATRKSKNLGTPTGGPFSNFRKSPYGLSTSLSSKVVEQTTKMGGVTGAFNEKRGSVGNV